MSKPTKNYFPINTKTSCQLKWSWTTIYLNSGISRTCHRTSESKLTPENFKNFHNTETVLEDRRKMLNGEWPESNCSYCRQIEENNGVSDRMNMLGIPDMYPAELDDNPNAINVTPTVVEVLFSNLCNLGCLYCVPEISSTINTENKKFNSNKSNDLKLLQELNPVESQYSKLLKSFWEWFPEGFPKLKRLHIQGGEPILQKEFDTLLDYIEQHPNPSCELNIITNLSYPIEKLEYFVKKFKNLLARRKLKRIDITCSIDCWGGEQEYIRYGIDLDQWEKNFRYLLNQKYLYLSINQAISVLSIKTIPILLDKLSEWRNIHPIHQSFGLVGPYPTYMNPAILPGDIWENDFEKILSLMPRDTERNDTAWKYMQGISKFCQNSEGNNDEIEKLKLYLNEKDYRRGTSWKKTFPWLADYLNE